MTASQAEPNNQLQPHDLLLSYCAVWSQVQTPGCPFSQAQHTNTNKITGRQTFGHSTVWGSVCVNCQSQLSSCLHKHMLYSSERLGSLHLRVLGMENRSLREVHKLVSIRFTFVQLVLYLKESISGISFQIALFLFRHNGRQNIGLKTYWCQIIRLLSLWFNENNIRYFKDKERES